MGLKAVANPAAGGQPGSFTTLTVSGPVTLSGGTANGVAYLNGSKVLTAGGALTFDGTNLLIGQTSNPNGVLLALGGSAVAGLPAVQNATFRGFKFGITDVVGDFGGAQMNIDTGEVRYTAGYGGYGGFHTWYAGGSYIGAWDSAGLSVTGSISATDFIAGAEQTAPSAPAANGYRIFAQDNGAGKTQLMVIFATGAAQQIAIEP